MLTRSGLGAAVAAVVLAAFGIWWRYEELVVIAVAVGVAIAIAVWSSRTRHGVQLVRIVASPRVARGDPVRTIYRATNPGRRRTQRATLVDRCDDEEIRVALPTVDGLDRAEVGGVIPTHRRGVFPVGPWVIERVDPFGLAIGRRIGTESGSIIVHPRVHRLHGPYGVMHTVEDESVMRRAASDPLSGFVSLREYVDGDDPRLIHWPTSARMGTLMLREHVELRRPEFTVVLDTAASVASPDDFEEMVDVAASVSVHALQSGVDVMLRTTSRAFPGSFRPIDRETIILDLLTPVMQADPDGSMSLAEVFHRGIDHAMVVFVTGPEGPSSTLAHTDALSVIRVGRGAVADRGIAMAAEDAAEFAATVATVALSRWRVLLVVMGAMVLSVMAGGVFDRFVPALLVSTLIVGAASLALATHGQRVRHALVVVVVIVAVFVAVLLTGGSLGDATSGIWSGPRRLITTEWPSPVEPTVVGTLALVLGVGTVVAGDLAARPRWQLAPALPLVAVLIIVLALGAPARPPWLLVAALGVVTAGLAVARYEADRPGVRWLATERTIMVSAGAIALATVVASGAVAWADRADPRRTEDAELTAPLLDPIEAAVALRQAEPALDLFRVEDRSTLTGPSLPARWRTAALDTYDGQRWVPRLTLRRIGDRLGLPSTPSPDVAPPIRYDLTLLTDDLDVLPFPGRPLSVDRDVETDLDRVAVRLTERPEPGTVVRAESEVAPSGGAATTSIVATRQVDEISGTFSAKARSLAGDGTVLEQLGSIATTMRDEWRLDSSAPGGGQQLALIERFVTDTQRGTNEQFVTAFVLLVRSLGFDARVATGFVVEPDEISSPLTIRSNQAAVWPEVRLDGVGWLAFDPVPSSEALDDEDSPPPPEAQSPAPAQPPIAPPPDEADDADEPEVDLESDRSPWGSWRVWTVRATTVSLLALLPFALLSTTILALKWRRRRRRLRSDEAAIRIRGAWANATDSLVDAGLSIPLSWTDDRIATAAMPLATGSPYEIRRLAAMSTAMTFGSTADAWRLADDAVLTSSAVDDAIRADRTRWERLRWRLSLRSLRRSTRSPVTV